MPLRTRLQNILAGLLAALVATVSLLFLMVLGRAWLGVTPPPEAIPDRVAPLLDIPTFFGLFNDYGGYNGLKRFGIRSGIQGVLAAGMLVGLIYPLVAETARSRRAGLAFGRLGLPRHGVAFMLVATLVLWVASVVFLWPVLVTSYIGLPPFDARLVTMGCYLFSYVVGYGAVFLLTYRFVTTRGPLAATPPSAATPSPQPPAASATTQAPAAAPADDSRRGDPSWSPGASAPSPSGDPAPATTPSPDTANLPEPRPADRRPVPAARLATRRALMAPLLAGMLMLPTWSLFRRLWGRTTFSYDGRPYSGPGVQPITPNAQFYSVTKNVVDPRIDEDTWRLEVWGLVNTPRTYTLSDLRQLAPLEQESTLMCISNRIGSGLMSNAVWGGVRLRTLLGETGVQEGAVEVKLTGADGYIDTFAIDRAQSDTPMLAWEMNGEPLPQKHGGPVRLVVPGLFGEKNIKWITGIEVVNYDAKGFYEQQGWGPNFEPYTRSDFYAPQVVDNSRFRDSVAPGATVTVRGRAFAGDRGIRSVEFSPDGGTTWQPVRVTYQGTPLTWTYWEADWTAPQTPGEVVLTSRAVDGDGQPQIGAFQDTVPQGAHGYHRVTMTVQ